MLITDIFRLSTRMFRTNRSRTILTILGISVGIGAILFLVSLGYGIQMLILNQITTSDALLSLDVSTGDLTNIKLDENAIDNLKKIPGVEKVNPMVSAQVQMNIGDIASELTANFANREYLRLEGTTLGKGEYYTDNASDKHKIIISASALNLFDLSEDNAIGQKVKLTVFKMQTSQKEGGTITRDSVKLDDDFEIAGIIADDDSNYIFIPFAVSQDIGISDYSKLKVKVDKDDHMDAVRSAIVDNGFLVSALSDIIEQANQVFKIVQIVLASFGIVALIVSAIGMFNTMTIALLERTQEIGIMKALGATSVDIWNMFLAESVIIGFLGGVGGIAIGIAGGEIFNYGVNILAGVLGGQKIDMFYTPMWFVLTITIFSTVVGLITGFYPARRAARINALEALRYK